MQLLPATPLLADQALFDRRRQRAVEMLRRRFEQAVTARPPLVFVAVSGYFLNGGDGYRKLERWPAFQRWLAAHYTLAVERPSAGEVRWWNRTQPEPGYRLYVLKGTPMRLEIGNR
jgi:nicotinic acid mononucleotide adenylyltransferase